MRSSDVRLGWATRMGDSDGRLGCPRIARVGLSVGIDCARARLGSTRCVCACSRACRSVAGCAYACGCASGRSCRRGIGAGAGALVGSCARARAWRVGEIWSLDPIGDFPLSVGVLVGSCVCVRARAVTIKHRSVLFTIKHRSSLFTIKHRSSLLWAWPKNSWGCGIRVILPK